jgi:hypothetical protein
LTIAEPMIDRLLIKIVESCAFSSSFN